MILRYAGLLACGLALLGCAAPMGVREAEIRANRSLKAFCSDTPCGTPKMLRAQKIKNRWMVDFDTAGGIYTVSVDSSGDTQVTVWDKNVPPAR